LAHSLLATIDEKFPLYDIISRVPPDFDELEIKAYAFHGIQRFLLKRSSIRGGNVLEGVGAFLGGGKD